MSFSEVELDHFTQQGYVVKPGLLGQKDLWPLCNSLNKIIDQGAKQLLEKGELSQIYDNEGFKTRLARIYQESEEAGQIIMGMIMGKGGGGFNGEAMLNLLRNQTLVDCVAELVGPDIVGASAYRIRPKLPKHTRTEVPWHQDSGYFLPHCDKYLIVTCWIPLVDVTINNGCLYVLPKAHNVGILKHYTGGHGGYLEIPNNELPSGNPVPIEMKFGDVLFMTNLTPHASFINQTEVVRWSIDLRYQSMDAPNNVEEDPQTCTPERDPVTMACYPSEADFVIRDSKDPSREVVCKEAFKQLRDRHNKARPYNPGRGWNRLKDKDTLKI